MMDRQLNSRRVRGALFALLIGLLTTFAYRPAWHGGFIWDDDYYVTKNALLTAPDGLRRIWFSLDAPSQYFPLTYTTFRIERALWDLNPTGYHWLNLSLHVANALLVWWLLAHLNVSGAWLGAAIFALHPVQVESVAWISELKNVLMGLFFLLTLLAWSAYIDLRTPRRWIFYAAALIFYSLALSAKTTACTLPAALLLILWLKQRPIDRRTIVQIIPFLLLAFGGGLVAVWWEKYHQGTRTLLVLAPVERVIVASRAIWFYLSKLIWPSNLTFIYPQWKINAADPLAYVWLIATIALCVAIYLARRRFGRSIEVAALFFVATLSPLLGFIMLYTFRYTYVSDHYQYLASIGLIALASAGLVRLSESVKHGRKLMSVLSTLIVGTLCLLTWRQSSNYRDTETLWRRTIANNPGCWMAYNNLGVMQFEKGDIDTAIFDYEKSLQLHPDYAEARYNLGNALLQKGKPDEAIVQCREALKLQPNDADAYVALGNALLTKQNVDQAISQYGKALALRPDHSDAHYNLANALEQKGQIAEAVFHYEKALELEPGLTEAHLNLGNILVEKHRDREALVHYEQALRSAPQSDRALNNLAWILASSYDASLRNGARAIQLALAASRSAGGKNPIALQVLAAAYAENRQFDKAIETAQRALELAQQAQDLAQTEELRREIQLYEKGSPYREP